MNSNPLLEHPARLRRSRLENPFFPYGNPCILEWRGYHADCIHPKDPLQALLASPKTPRSARKHPKIFAASWKYFEAAGALADKELTKTSIIVTTVFFVTMSAENWRYFLGRIGIICYEKNVFQLIFGVFLASINSCANPFIYAISLPCFRRSLKRILKFSND